ncbi:MAG: T9SS type A sorting domain-containing protein [Melioribacteraceae bacterium]|nr:T9SS type A sorting domain-containing protein [Melioribacteraceae bacterium]
MHQYVVAEAYKLFKLYMGTDVPKILSHLGSNETGGYVNWYSRGVDDFSDGTIACGAFREDVKDIVYNYGDEPSPPGVSEALYYSFASVTHFWDADLGDNYLTNFYHDPRVPYFDIPNAYQKVMKYVNDMWIGYYGAIKVNKPDGGVDYITGLNGRTISFYYNDLIEFYKTGEIYVIFAAGQNVSYVESILYVDEDVRHRIAFEILGRIAHLLTDMSVPAHIHNNAHAEASDETYEKEYMHIDVDDSPYSNSNVNFWDAQKIWNDFGDIINPYLSNDTPLHHLMYTVNQYADHFASHLYNGDDNYNSNTELASHYPVGIAPTSSITYNTPYSPYTKDILHQNIRDATFPHAIRAVAGLFYWFMTECQIEPIPLSGVNLTGTSTLYQDGTGQWVVNLENGKGPFHYDWYIKYDDFSKSVPMLDSKIPIDTRAPQSGTWISVGTDDRVFEKPFPYDGRGFELKCDVEDVMGGVSMTTNVYYVNVVATPHPELKKSLPVENENIGILYNDITYEEYRLSENYPNPFNPTTKISYQLPESGFVSLKVYNSLGKEVAELVNEVKGAGRYNATFNASKLSSGIYFYTIQVNDFVQTNKMLLVK